MQIKKVQSIKAVETIQDFILGKKYGIAYCVHDKKSIFVTDSVSINNNACITLGYDVLDTRHTGGAVVVSSGDISIIHFGKIGNNWMHRFAHYLIDEYRKRGLNATFDGNDILIDDYKISGLSATLYNNLQYSTIHIGINTNIEHIKAICTKPMVKIPKGLAEYGITTEEVEQMFLAFYEQNKDN